MSFTSPPRSTVCRFAEFLDLEFPLGLFLVFSSFQGQGLGRFLSDWAGLGGSCVFSSCRPPCSVLGRGRGNRAAKSRHGTVVFSCAFRFRPADALLSPSRGDGQGDLATHTVAQNCVLFCLFSLLCMLYCLFSVSYTHLTLPTTPYV